jgi:hypothetical protein
LDPVWLFALAASLLVSWPMLFWGLGRDQGNLGYMGWMLTRGRLPYMLTWDSNFPGVFLIHALQIMLLGTSALAFRVFDILMLLVIVTFIYKIAAFLAGRWAGFAAALSYTLMYLTLGYWHTGQREACALLFTLVGIWGLFHYGSSSVVRRPASGERKVEEKSKSLPLPQRRWLIIMGLAGGAAILTRPQFAPILLACVAWAFWQDTLAGRTVRARIENLALQVGLFALPLVLWLIICAIAGGLNQFLSAVVTYNLTVHSSIHQRFGDIWSSFTSFVPVFLWIGTVLLLLESVECRVSSAERRSSLVTRHSTLFFEYTLLIASALVMWFIARLIEHKSWEYHRIPVFAFTAIMGAAGLATVVRPFFSDEGRTSCVVRRASSVVPRPPFAVRRSWVAIAALIAGFVLWAQAVFPWSTVRSVLHNKSVEGDFPNETMYTSFNVERDVEVAQYIREKTDPGDYIQVWGGAAIIYYLAHREASSRFQASTSLVAHAPGGDITPLQADWRREFLLELENRPPKYFIVEDNDWPTYMGLANNENSPQLLYEFSDLSKWLVSGYHLEGTIDNFRIYGKR